MLFRKPKSPKLHEPPDPPPRKTNCHIGLYQEHVTDLRALMKLLEHEKYDSAVISIKHPYAIGMSEAGPSTSIGIRSDIVLGPRDWSNKIIAKLSEILDVDSHDADIQARDETALIHELRHAYHLAPCGVVFVKLKLDREYSNLARILMQHYTTGAIHMEVPMVRESRSTWRRESVPNGSQPPTDPWLDWNDLRTQSGFASHIKVALVMTTSLPDETQIRRWLSEPVNFIIINADIFVLNQFNHPVLSHQHQVLIKRFLEVTKNFVVKANPDSTIPLNRYSEYLDALVQKLWREDYLVSYANKLEVPLQPLYDNLDAYTYEIFEMDPVKYKLYQTAIERALDDKVPVKERDSKTVIVMVLGAGRGPLVRAAINASQNVNVKVKIIVVEKNPHAIIALESHIREIWQDHDVSLVSSDMRDLQQPSEKADIVVSELLGSFGDNELSPECLDGVQQYLKPDGISIPSSSTSYLNPVMAPKLYTSCCTIHKLTPCIARSSASHTAVFESTYVVYPKHAFPIADPQKVFVFEHPNFTGGDNSRSTVLRFVADADALLHGFVGYFESTLYKDVMISIHPFTHTQGMPSWFPFYLPISVPQFVKQGQQIELNFWRCTNAHQVWYEWCVNKPYQTHTHNLNGEYSKILK